MSNRQMFFTFVIAVSHSFGLPNFLIQELKQDFWQPIILAVGVEVLFAWMLYKMGLYYSRQTIYQYSEKIVGKIPGKIITLLFSLFFISIACILTGSISLFYSSIIMPETPRAVFAIGLLVVSCYAVYAGIEPTMRLAEIIGAVYIISVLAMAVFNFKWYDFGNLEPMFQHEWTEVLQALPMPISWFSVCIVLGVLMAYQNQPKDAFKVKVSGVILGMFLLTLIAIATILVLGVEFGSRQNYPGFLLARLVMIGDFIERLESIQVATWTASSFYAIAIFHFSGVEGMQQLMPKRSRNFLNLLVAGLIAFIAVILFPLSKDHFELSKTILLNFLLPLEIILIFTLFGVWFGKKKIRQWKKRMRV
ncbi:MAG: endospore germination permease [Desulfitobacterium sp.]|nr:endospore germination permease [Desulfitobacterium sp.]